MKEPIKAYWFNNNNVGDTLTPIIVEHFLNREVQWVGRHSKDKLLGVGSIMKSLRVGNVVWGTGIMYETDRYNYANKCKFLAVRGRLTEKILGVNIGVYGDPALLLPLMYKPKILKTRELGYCPHYIDQDLFIGKKIVNVRQNWKDFIDDLLQYERIETSSLHGMIIALAYGIPAKWVKYSDRVLGDGFKFRDFGTGVGLDIKEGIWYNGIDNLKETQDNLIKALKKHYE
jgi:pyruvyltransferase